MNQSPVLRTISETTVQPELPSWRALFTDGTEILLNEYNDGVKVIESDSFAKWVIQGKHGAAVVETHQRLKDFLSVLKYVKG